MGVCKNPDTCAWVFPHVIVFFLLSFSQAPASHLDQRIHNSSQPPDLHLSFRDFFCICKVGKWCHGMDSALFPQLAESSALLELEELLDGQDGTSAQQRLASALRLCGRNLAPLPTVADQATASNFVLRSPSAVANRNACHFILLQGSNMLWTGTGNKLQNENKHWMAAAAAASQILSHQPV